MPELLKSLSQRALPEHLFDRTPDASGVHGCRFTGIYRRKRALVKNLWMGAALLVLLQPTTAFLITVTLAMTFLALIVLDETP